MRHARPDYDGIQDPTGKIPADEPVFLIRGQDPTAALIVRAWADAAERLGADAELVRLAREQADAMDAWPTKKAVPDLPAPGAAHAPPPTATDPTAKFELFPDSFDAWSPEQVLEFEDWFVALPIDHPMPAFANKAAEEAWADATERLSGDNGGPAGAVETPADPA